MSQWTHILNREEIAARHALTARLDPAFAARERAFYETRTKAQLETLASQAWDCNSPTGYQMARSYAALASAV